jgi:hypothetical protein
MTTRSSIKLLGSGLLSSAALALGIATVSLWPESASANVVFDFSGTCDFGCSGTATGVLTLTNAYVYGTDITSTDFVSFSYTSSDLSFDITSASTSLEGGLNSDGSFDATGELIVVVASGAGEFEFASVPGQFAAGTWQDPSQDVGYSFTFTNVTSSVPEPSTWAMMLLGFAGLAFAGVECAGRDPSRSLSRQPFDLRPRFLPGRDASILDLR